MVALWSLDRPFCPHWYGGDSEVVIYDEISGETHCVSLLACEILRLLISGAHTESGLIEYLGDQFEVDEDDQLDEHIMDALIQLRRLHLVKQS